MTGGPSPFGIIATKPVTLACEVDAGFRRLHARSCAMTILEYREYLQDLDTRLVIHLVEESAANPESCWNLHIDDSPARVDQVKKLRQEIAKGMGLYPASTYSFLPEYKVANAIHRTADFSVRCLFLRRLCLRPSHLQLAYASGQRVPTVLYP